MRIRFITAAAWCCAAALPGCGESPDLGGGFALVDGGGSKVSLTRNGLVLISHTVTGLGRQGDSQVIESKPYESATCLYYRLDKGAGELKPIALDGAAPGRVEALAAVQAVEPINSRSCRAGR